MTGSGTGGTSGGGGQACLYLYGVAEGAGKDGFGPAGIDGHRVYCVEGEGLTALVHACGSQPYVSDDRKVVESWVKAQNDVLYAAMCRFGGVIPFAFDTIIKPDHRCADAVLREWLRQNRESLASRLRKVRGRAEYVVRILWHRKLLAERLLRESRDLEGLREGIRHASRGMAYFLQLKAERALKRLLEERAERVFHQVYDLLRACCEDVVPEKPDRTGDDWEVLSRFACLAGAEAGAELPARLGDVGAGEEFSARLSGPYPPYSFV